MLRDVPGVMAEKRNWLVSRENLAVFGVALGLGVWIADVRSAAAVSLSLNPSQQSIAVGEALSLDVAIVDLGNFSTPSVSTFDFDLGFDPSVLSFIGLTFGDSLLGDQVDLSGTARQFTDLGIFDAVGFSAIPGVVNFFEESFDLPQDLDTLQPEAFTLATLDFVALGDGNGDLAVTLNALGDSQGNPLTLDTIEVTPVLVTGPIGQTVPEPMTSWLGLLGLVAASSWGIKKTDLAQCRRSDQPGRQRRC